MFTVVGPSGTETFTGDTPADVAEQYKAKHGDAPQAIFAGSHQNCMVVGDNRANTLMRYIREALDSGYSEDVIEHLRQKTNGLNLDPHSAESNLESDLMVVISEAIEFGQDDPGHGVDHLYHVVDDIEREYDVDIIL